MPVYPPRLPATRNGDAAMRCDKYAPRPVAQFCVALLLQFAHWRNLQVLAEAAISSCGLEPNLKYPHGEGCRVQGKPNTRKRHNDCVEIPKALEHCRPQRLKPYKLVPGPTLTLPLAAIRPVDLSRPEIIPNPISKTSTH